MFNKNPNNTFSSKNSTGNSLSTENPINQIDSRTIFKNVHQISEYMHHFQHFSPHYNGTRTITYVCTSSNLKPNSPALQKNKNVKRNCTAAIFFGYLKEKDIWYLKRFNYHGKFCKFNLENEIKIDFDGILEKAEKKTTSSKRKEVKFDFISFWLTNRSEIENEKNKILQRVGAFLNQKRNELRYEIVHHELITYLLKNNIRGYFGIKKYNFFFINLSEAVTNIDSIKTESIEGLELFYKSTHEIFNDKFKDFELENLFITDIKNFNEILTFFYQFYSEIRENEFSIISEDLSSNFAYEFNFLNKNNKMIAESINHNSNETNSSIKKGVNFLFDLSNCRRNVFELKIYERKSRDITDIIKSESNEKMRKFTVQINSFNGADRRELVAQSVFEFDEEKIGKEILVENFLKFFLMKISGKKINNTQGFNDFQSILDVSSFIIPYDTVLIDILSKIEFPFFVNTRSLTEFLLVFHELKISREVDNDSDFYQRIAQLKSQIGNIFELMNNALPEKENPDYLSNLRKTILNEIYSFEKDEIAYKLTENNLFVSRYLNSSNKIKQLFNLNNSSVSDFEEIILQKLKFLKYDVTEVHNTKYTFSTFFDMQWTFGNKNEEIDKEKKRIVSIENIDNLVKNETLKLDDLNYNLNVKNGNILEIIINTDIKFIMKSLVESFKNIPHYLSRQIFRKMAWGIEKFEKTVKKSSFSIILKRENFVANNIFDRKIIEKLDLEKSQMDEIHLNFNNKKENNKNQENFNYFINFYKTNENRIIYECSCKDYNVEFIPCFHLILLMSLFNPMDSNTLVFDFLSPVYGMVSNYDYINVVGQGKFDAQKLGRPKK